MSFMDLITHRAVLINPCVTINTLGVLLTYPDQDTIEQVLLNLSTVPGLVPPMKDGFSIIISHRALCSFLLSIGISQQGLNDAIEVFYLEKHIDRAERLAAEAGNPAVAAQPLSTDCFHVENVAMGPRPNQLIAKVNVRLPAMSGDHMQNTPARVVFILDHSGSMALQGRLEMLKPAVLNTIENLAPNTLVSVYFYNNTYTVLFENKPVSSISAEDRLAISSVQAAGGTTISSIIPVVVNNFRVAGLLHDEDAFENITVVWVTDGDDTSISESDNLVQLFQAQGCMSMPKVIAVGMGAYNQHLLNGVAEDMRFKSNLMLHIHTPDQTGELFGFVSRCVGVGRRRVILAINVDAQMTHQDLGVMQAEQTKTLLIELPMPLETLEAPHLACRLLINNEIYQCSAVLAPGFRRQDTQLLIEYFTQLSAKIVLAQQNSPEVAMRMKQIAFASIPSTTKNAELLALRDSFMPTTGTRSLREVDLQQYNPSFFNLPDEDDTLNCQRQYSIALRTLSI